MLGEVVTYKDPHFSIMSESEVMKHLECSVTVN